MLSRATCSVSMLIILLWPNKFPIELSFVVVYITGRGRRSHAYTHSVQVDHHVFLNLHTLKVNLLDTLKSWL